MDFTKITEAEPTPPVVEEKEDGWYYHDEAWQQHGPYKTRADAQQAVNLYAAVHLEDPRNHVTEDDWNAMKVAEEENCTHPCDHWKAFACMCAAACSCHMAKTQTTKEPV